MVQAPEALSRLRAAAGARGGGLSGRLLHVQHHRRGADLRGALPRNRSRDLARSALDGAPDRRDRADDHRAVHLLPLLQDAVPRVRPRSSVLRPKTSFASGARARWLPDPELAAGGRERAQPPRRQPEDLAQCARSLPAPLHAGRRRALDRPRAHERTAGDAIRHRGGRRGGGRRRRVPAGGRIAAVRRDRLLAGRGTLGPGHHDRRGPPLHRLRLRRLRPAPGLRDGLRVECRLPVVSWRRQGTPARPGCGARCSRTGTCSTSSSTRRYASRIPAVHDSAPVHAGGVSNILPGTDIARPGPAWTTSR